MFVPGRKLVPDEVTTRMDVDILDPLTEEGRTKLRGPPAVEVTLEPGPSVRVLLRSSSLPCLLPRAERPPGVNIQEDLCPRAVGAGRLPSHGLPPVLVYTDPSTVLGLQRNITQKLAGETPRQGQRGCPPRASEHAVGASFPLLRASG